jgi:GNAT superfamily N-acetyltransferase
VNLRTYEITHLSDLRELDDFYCGIKLMDDFIHSNLDTCIRHHFCSSFCLRNNSDKKVLAFFALSFDSLDLDDNDLDDMMKGFSGVEKPELSLNYKNIFLSKHHYPALEISYLAVRKDYQGHGIGKAIIEKIAKKAGEQDFAGCQFLTVEALHSKNYQASNFYSKCNFAPCELPNPKKDTLRMFRTLYPSHLNEMD